MNLLWIYRIILYSIFILSYVWANAASDPVPTEDDNRQILNINAQFKNMNLKGPTFTGTVDPIFITAFITDIGEEYNAQISVLIDATDGKYFFPIEEKPRHFSDKEAVFALVAKTFSSENHDPRSGQGAYLRLEDTYFYDPNPGLAYRVTDPVLAFIGGASGTIIVDGKTICLDPDNDCGKGYPSYLSPVGQTTAPTDMDFCGRIIRGVPVCVHHHTFFNRTWWFGTYVRHGTNTRFTNWAALPSSQIRLSLVIGSASTITLPSVIGNNSAELARFCWGDCPSDIEGAPAVCGTSVVIDPDLSGTPNDTGNGPSNHPTTPFCTIFI